MPTVATPHRRLSFADAAAAAVGGRLRMDGAVGAISAPRDALAATGWLARHAKRKKGKRPTTASPYKHSVIKSRAPRRPSLIGTAMLAMATVRKGKRGRSPRTRALEERKSEGGRGGGGSGGGSGGGDGSGGAAGDVAPEGAGLNVTTSPELASRPKVETFPKGEKAMKELISELRETVREQRAELAEREAAVESARLKRAEADERVKKAVRGLNEARKERKQALWKLEKIEASWHSGDEWAELTSSLKAVQEQLRKEREEALRKTIRLSTLKASLARVEAALAERRGEVERLEEAVKRGEKAFAYREVQSREARGRVEAMKRQRAKEEEVVTTLTARVSALEDRLRQSELNLRVKEGKLADARSRLKKAEAELGADGFDKDKLTAKAARAAYELEQQRRHNAALKSKLERQTAALDKLHAQYDDARKEVVALRSELERKELQFRTLKERLDEQIGSLDGAAGGDAAASTTFSPRSLRRGVLASSPRAPPTPSSSAREPSMRKTASALRRMSQLAAASATSTRRRLSSRSSIAAAVAAMKKGGPAGLPALTAATEEGDGEDVQNMRAALMRAMEMLLTSANAALKRATSCDKLDADLLSLLSPPDIMAEMTAMEAELETPVESTAVKTVESLTRRSLMLRDKVEQAMLLALS